MNPNLCILLAAFPRYRTQLLASSPAPYTGVLVKPLKRVALITALGQALDARRSQGSVSQDLAASRRDSMPTPVAQLNVLVAEVCIISSLSFSVSPLATDSWSCHFCNIVLLHYFYFISSPVFILSHTLFFIRTMPSRSEC